MQELPRLAAAGIIGETQVINVSAELLHLRLGRIAAVSAVVAVIPGIMTRLLPKAAANWRPQACSADRSVNEQGSQGYLASKRMAPHKQLIEIGVVQARQCRKQRQYVQRVIVSRKKTCRKLESFGNIVATIIRHHYQKSFAGIYIRDVSIIIARS